MSEIVLSFTQLVQVLKGIGKSLPISGLTFEAEKIDSEHQNEPSFGPCIRIVCWPNGLFGVEADDDESGQPPHFYVRAVCKKSCDEFTTMQRFLIPVLLHLVAEVSFESKYQFGLGCAAGETRKLLESLSLTSQSPTQVSSRMELVNSSPFDLAETDWRLIREARRRIRKFVPSKTSGGSRPTPTKPAPKKNEPIETIVTKDPVSDWKDINQATEEPQLNSGSINKKVNPMTNDRTRLGFFDSPPPLTSEQIAELKKHVVNLNVGKFSTGGDFVSSKTSTKAIFEKHLPEWVDAQTQLDEVNVVFYSHGGLTNEEWGLATAAKQVKFWKENGVYPIFFVWETGLLETLGQLWFGGEQRGWAEESRGLFDWVGDAKDKLIAEAVRAFQAPRIWEGMKSSAKAAFDADENGDGLTVLEMALDFYNDCPYDVNFHCVGHSAGSIFLSYAIQAAFETWEEYPEFETVHFLAPAITTALFKQTIRPLIGRGENKQARHLSMFTMRDDLEKADKVGPYGRSLLYLIYEALEPVRKTPILGLEASVQADDELAEFFGLDGSNPQLTDLILSKSSLGPYDSRSKSVTHGGFDDDVDTMNSVVRRIIKAKDADEISPFPEATGREIRSKQLPASMSSGASGGSSSFTPVHTSGSSNFQSRATGSSKALCIGINEYRSAPLYACESDSKRWGKWFKKSGFDVEIILSKQATRSRMVEAIDDLITNSRAGDVLAIQYSGHGTSIRDLNSDELGGSLTPKNDEALVPVDYLKNGLLLDDDLGELCRKVPDGVSVTFFMDCCHSGTISRLFMRANAGVTNGRSRFLPPTREMIEANNRARSAGMRGMRSGGNPYEGAAEIVFAACHSGEPAWESNGSGDFTRHALGVLEATGGNLSNESFMANVKTRFGPSARQTPGLWCDSDFTKRPLLGGEGGRGDGGGGSYAASSGSNDDAVRQAIKILEGVVGRQS